VELTQVVGPRDLDRTELPHVAAHEKLRIEQQQQSW
jgi:hypothetical protein